MVIFYFNISNFLCLFHLYILFKIIDTPLDNTLNQCPIPAENGNNEVQSITSGPEIEGLPMSEPTVLAQVVRSCAAK